MARYQTLPQITSRIRHEGEGIREAYEASTTSARIRRFIEVTTGSPLRALVAFLVNIVLAGWVYALIEHHGPVEGPWWGIVTGSTTGYGDFYPHSTAGRAVGAYLMISSIVLVAIFTAQVVSHVIPNPDRWSDDEQRRLFDQLERIENRVNRLEARHDRAAD